ncbi:tyrosine-type recombinase/integrase [Actinopolymorpha pittospori]
MIDKWLAEVLDVATSTRTAYEGNIRKHIRPSLGPMPQQARPNGAAYTPRGAATADRRPAVSA